MLFVLQGVADPALGEEEAQKGCIERDHDGDAPQAGHGFAVNLARGQSVIQRAKALGDPTHDRSQQRGAQHRKDKRNGCGAHS